MPPPVALKIATPALGLGMLLFAISVFAAVKIQQQQARSSEMVAREVYGLLAVSQLHITMREIRYQLNLFIRTRDQRHVDSALTLGAEADRELRVASDLVRNTEEHELIEAVEDGYRRFHAALADLASPDVHAPGEARPDSYPPPSDEVIAAVSLLADEQLTNDVLQPLFDSMVVNREVLELMDDAGRATAHSLTTSLLMLGTCGAAAGLLFGVVVARAVADRLRQSETELLRREQLAQVGQLAAGMAHELRNPLMPMKMLVQAAMERRDAGLVGRSLAVVDEEITRLEKSIQGFLDFARPASPQKTRIDIRDVVSPTIDLVSARAARQCISVTTRIPPRPVMARADRGQIRQLLLNLLLNSMDAMPEGGTIEVSVEEVPVGPGPGLAIRVVDDGTGVPEHLFDRVFEPFVTTKQAGAGLGLSLCTQIAAAHGGRITARNGMPRGSEFVLTMPTDTAG